MAAVQQHVWIHPHRQPGSACPAEIGAVASGCLATGAGSRDLRRRDGLDGQLPLALSVIRPGAEVETRAPVRRAAVIDAGGLGIPR